MTTDPRWILGSATPQNSEHSVSVRLLAEKPSTWSALPDAIVVRWRFSSEGTVEDILSDVERFEDLMRPFWNATSSCLTLVLTYADCREWVFYAADVRAFVVALKEIVAGTRKYPIGLEYLKDPLWSYWAEYETLLK